MEELRKDVKEYLKCLSTEMPEFLKQYMNTKEFKRLKGVGMLPGTDYTKLFQNYFYYSRYEHSIGVALIIWHFTKDKKQTIAGLLHDIASPAFSHVVDFINKDYMTQESTEQETKEIIKNSEEIMYLLKRDGIKIEEVADYKIYPIADNKTPKLSADRLEYSFLDPISLNGKWDLKEIKEIYDDIIILKNEEDEIEIGFQSIEIAEKFVKREVEFWNMANGHRFKMAMQLLCDIIKQAIEENEMQLQDLYKYSELEIIQRLQNSKSEKIKKNLNYYQRIDHIYLSTHKMEGKYCIPTGAKKRYINPLVKQENKSIRITQISEISEEIIEKIEKRKATKYIYTDFILA